MTSSTTTHFNNFTDSTADHYVSLDTFLHLSYNQEDAYKYEWNDGKIEQIPTMNQEQAVIQAILFRIFAKTKVFQEGGLFTSETDMHTSTQQLRRPDLAIYTAAQLEGMKQNENQVAHWLAEVISEHDNINRVQAKLEEYFDAGVEVVWHIFPYSKQVYVYTSTETVEICKNETVCSAKPAFPDFEIQAKLLFE